MVAAPSKNDLRELVELGRLLDGAVELDGELAIVTPKGRPVLTWSPSGRTLFALAGVKLPKPVAVDELELPPRAARLYEQWAAGRPASRVREVSSSALPSGRWVDLGPAISIGYRSDKFHDRGRTVDYQHEFTSAVRLYQLERILAWRGGRLRVTAAGIEG